jgi:putative lipoic acid-binding regulatory protein
MTEETSLIVFPCDFPIKMIGKYTDTLIAEITALILEVFPETPLDQITHQFSQNNHYISITAIVYALDQPTLDRLYHQLTAHPQMKMVL